MSATPGRHPIPFGFLRGNLGLLIVIVVVCFALIALIILGGTSPTHAVVIGTPLALLVVLSANYLRKSRARISVNDDGITHFSRRGKTTFIGWDEVGKVEAQEFFQRLVVSDVGGLRQIKLSYHRENFDRLRELVLDRSAKRRSLLPVASEFHRKLVQLVWPFVFVLFFAAIGVFAVLARNPIAAIICFPIAGAMLYYGLRQERKLTVSRDALRIDYICGYRTIPFKGVKNIELQSVRNEEAPDVATAVLVQPLTDKPLKLTGFRGDPVAMYDALRRRWRESAGSPAAEPSAHSVSLDSNMMPSEPIPKSRPPI
jgi:hypothetical protein